LRPNLQLSARAHGATDPGAPQNVYSAEPAADLRRWPANRKRGAGLLGSLPTLIPPALYPVSAAARLWTASGTAQMNGGPQLP